MKLLLLAALASVPCTPPATLTPDESAIGATFDASPYAPNSTLTPNTTRASTQKINMPPYSIETTADEIRWRLKRGLCPSRTAVTGIITGRQFAVSPGNKSVFGIYTFDVEAVPRPLSAPNPIMANTTIKLIRKGGSVCTDAGELREVDMNLKVLEVGTRYLLFLKPAQGEYFETSAFDWELSEPARPNETDSDSTTVPAAALIADLHGVACE